MTRIQKEEGRNQATKTISKAGKEVGCLNKENMKTKESISRTGRRRKEIRRYGRGKETR